MGPDYVQPDFEQNIQLDVDADEYIGLVPQKADISQWWRVFDDAILDLIINDAIANNLDLKIAIARLDESRAQLGITKADKLPTVDAGASVFRNQQSEVLTGVDRDHYDQYGVNIDASWEVDLWGKVRRNVEAAQAEYQASQEDRNDFLISVCADVARTYFTIRTLQSQEVITLENLESQKKIVKLVQDLRAAGLSSGLEEDQSIRVYAASQTLLPSLRTKLIHNINALSVLLGKSPGYVNHLLASVPVVPLPPDNVAIDIAADRVRLRPDVRRAERQLAAQTARIGVATADLYPALTLSGSLGTGTLHFDDLFSSGSGQYSIGPSVRLNLFNRQRLRQQIQVEDARTTQALHRYESTVLNAVKDVENALSAYHGQQLQLDSLHNAMRAAQSVMDKSQDLYRSGLIDFQVVLDAERSLLEMENNYASGRGNTSILLVGLYRALAGGWDMDKSVEE
ncbi:MAG: efflux transporter outer membrane subunit [Deltaproteobacteria bacterium]|nr:efflux transporter outer membrane subunit [Deltaproteobacteria bacterium]